MPSRIGGRAKLAGGLYSRPPPRGEIVEGSGSPADSTSLPSHGWGSQGASLECDDRPDSLDDSERPSAREEPVRRRQSATECGSQDVDATPPLKRVLAPRRG
jgi:hypothetical protein